MSTGAGVQDRRPIQTFRDLLVWQKAITFAAEVYRLSKQFPADEQFGLTLQLRKAAVSVSSNIAEGHARQGKEFAYFLSVARGSLAECESQLHLATVLGYLSDADVAPPMSLACEIQKMSAVLASKLPR